MKQKDNNKTNLFKKQTNKQTNQKKNNKRTNRYL